MCKSKIKSKSRFIFILAFSMLASTNLMAGIQDNIVKIRSYPCGDLAKVRTGSAALVEDTRLGQFILTSSHVIYHGNRTLGICSEVLGSDGNWYEANLKLVNSGIGIATLEGNTNFWSLSHSTLKLASAQESKEGDSVELRGYPLASNQVANEHGKILLSKSARTILPLVSHVIEVQNAHNEYGMSGGALVDSNSGAYLGLLSHQYLKIAPGRKAVAHTITAGTSTEGAQLIAMVIPANTIQTWLDHADQQSSTLAEDLNDQRRGAVSFTFGSLKFSEMVCDGTGSVGGEGLGVGGEGLGVGGEGLGVGGEGLGVGGTDDLNRSVCKIKVERVAANATKQQKWPLASSRSWFERLNDRVVFGKPLWFNRVYLREQQQQVRGLLHALTLINHGYLPLVQSDDASDYRLPADVASRIAVLKASFGPIEELSTRNDAPEEAKRLMEFLKFFLEAVESENWGIIDVKYTRNAIYVGPGGSFVDGWNYVYSMKFDDAVQLVKQITWLTDAVERAR